MVSFPDEVIKRVMETFDDPVSDSVCLAQCALVQQQWTTHAEARLYRELPRLWYGSALVRLCTTLSSNPQKAFLVREWVLRLPVYRHEYLPPTVVYLLGSALVRMTQLQHLDFGWPDKGEVIVRGFMGSLQVFIGSADSFVPGSLARFLAHQPRLTYLSVIGEDTALLSIPITTLRLLQTFIGPARSAHWIVPRRHVHNVRITPSGFPLEVALRRLRGSLSQLVFLEINSPASLEHALSLCGYLFPTLRILQITVPLRPSERQLKLLAMVSSVGQFVSLDKLRILPTNDPNVSVEDMLEEYSLLVRYHHACPALTEIWLGSVNWAWSRSDMCWQPQRLSEDMAREWGALIERNEDEPAIFRHTDDDDDSSDSEMEIIPSPPAPRLLHIELSDVEYQEFEQRPLFH